MEEITLVIPNKLDCLQKATTLSREVCKAINSPHINDEFINAVELAVSEACTNAILHSENRGNNNPELTKKVILSFHIYQDKLVINVKDSGMGFDINNISTPDFEGHPEGGYGIYIIKSRMDNVEYVKEKNWNRLSMTKYFKAADGMDNEECKS